MSANFRFNFFLMSLRIVKNAMTNPIKCLTYFVTSPNFIFNVKENQPTLKKLVEAAFADNESKVSSESTLITKAHGRIDTRECVTKNWSSELANQHAFPFISQICRIKRTWTDLDGNNPKGETRYFITSASSKTATAETLLLRYLIIGL